MKMWHHKLFGETWTETGKTRSDDVDTLVQLTCETLQGGLRYTWISVEDLTTTDVWVQVA